MGRRGFREAPFFVAWAPSILAFKGLAVEDLDFRGLGFRV